MEREKRDAARARHSAVVKELRDELRRSLERTASAQAAASSAALSAAAAAAAMLGPCPQAPAPACEKPAVSREAGTSGAGPDIDAAGTNSARSQEGGILDVGLVAGVKQGSASNEGGTEMEMEVGRSIVAGAEEACALAGADSVAGSAVGTAMTSAGNESAPSSAAHGKAYAPLFTCELVRPPPPPSLALIKDECNQDGCGSHGDICNNATDDGEPKMPALQLAAAADSDGERAGEVPEEKERSPQQQVAANTVKVLRRGGVGVGDLNREEKAWPSPRAKFTSPLRAHHAGVALAVRLYIK